MHAAARLTRGAAATAAPGRRRATADHPGGLGSARVHVCWPAPLHSPEDWRTYARHIRREVLNAHLRGIFPQLVDRGSTDHPGCGFGPHCHGLLASPPGRHARGRPTLCRGLVSGVLCPDTAHAAVLSCGDACARQPVCGPRPEPEAGRAATRVVLAPKSLCRPRLPPDQ